MCFCTGRYIERLYDWKELTVWTRIGWWALCGCQKILLYDWTSINGEFKSSHRHRESKFFIDVPGFCCESEKSEALLRILSWIITLICYATANSWNPTIYHCHCTDIAYWPVNWAARFRVHVGTTTWRHPKWQTQRWEIRPDDLMLLDRWDWTETAQNIHVLPSISGHPPRFVTRDIDWSESRL